MVSSLSYFGLLPERNTKFGLHLATVKTHNHLEKLIKKKRKSSSVDKYYNEDCLQLNAYGHKSEYPLMPGFAIDYNGTR